MKSKFLRTKKVFAAILTGAMVFSSMGVSSFAAQKLYDEVTKETITKGVTYEYNHRLTAEGWNDIHVLKMDLTDPNLSVAPVESATEYGLKDTVLKMISDSGAVAGVNADFFGLKGNYSASFGPVIKDGEIVSIGADKNHDKKEFATFFMNKDGNPFIDYFNFKADFYANTNSHLELASYNKITEMIYPIYFDKQAAKSTADLDKRFPELVKIVVENDFITKISAKGETIQVPENGYLIILSGQQYDGVMQYFTPGQSAELKISASLDLNNIQTAVSGAGKILQDGQTVSDGGLVIAGRQPRTALGISQDASTLILMVVDGRSHSIGATHEEIAALLREYGAYNAMHLDGGGSSTMVAKTVEDANTEVKNTFSDGAPRKVMNSVGVFNNAPIGEITQIAVKPSQDKAFIGNNVNLDIFGYDEYYHKMEIPKNEVVFSMTGGEGNFDGTNFVPITEGEFFISATWNSLSAVTKVMGMDVASITPNAKSLNLGGAGHSGTIGISGVSTEGFSAPISGGVTYELSDPSLGTISGNVFTASKDGAGYIKCTLGNASCYIAVSIGGAAKVVNSFESQSDTKFSAFPTTGITGTVLTSDKYFNDGKKSLALQYTFSNSTATQAAYLDFSNGVKIPGEPTAINLSVFGNQSGHWLRAKAHDVNGKQMVLDFTKDINWSNTWKDVSAVVPAGVSYPVTIDSIYIAALANVSTVPQTLYFDKLSGVYPNSVKVDLPADTKVIDKKQGTVNVAGEGSYYINMVGSVSSGTVKDIALYESERAKVKQTIEKDANLAIFAGRSDISAASNIDTIKWNAGYQFYSKPNTSIVQLTASNGGLRTTNASQWISFKNDVLASENQNVIFIMDKTPTSFSDPMETLLFRSAMNDIRLAGKTIFVVSSSETGEWNTVKDGVRYINLPDLWTPDGKLNKNFSMLKFSINGNDVTYEIVKMQ